MKPTSDDWDAEEREALEPVREQLEALRAQHAGDPPVELLRAARGNALPDDIQVRVNRHLEESAWARAVVDGTDEVPPVFAGRDEDRLLARIRHTAARERRSAMWRRVGLPLVASVGMALIAVVLVLRSGQIVPQAPPPTVPTVPPSAAPPATTIVPHLAIDKPSVKLSPRALTYRGTSGDRDFLTAIKPALDAFRDDDYARADREFGSLAPRYPESVEIPFYRGVARLFLNDVDGATAALNDAERLADTSFAPDVVWYRAIADDRAGRTADARTRLDLLCKDPGNPRRAGACRALERFK